MDLNTAILQSYLTFQVKAAQAVFSGLSLFSPSF